MQVAEFYMTRAPHFLIVLPVGNVFPPPSRSHISFFPSHLNHKMAGDFFFHPLNSTFHWVLAVVVLPWENATNLEGQFLFQLFFEIETSQN